MSWDISIAWRSRERERVFDCLHDIKDRNMHLYTKGGVT